MKILIILIPLLIAPSCATSIVAPPEVLPPLRISPHPLHLSINYTAEIIADDLIDAEISIMVRHEGDEPLNYTFSLDYYWYSPKIKSMSIKADGIPGKKFNYTLHKDQEILIEISYTADNYRKEFTAGREGSREFRRSINIVELKIQVPGSYVIYPDPETLENLVEKPVIEKGDRTSYWIKTSGFPPLHFKHVPLHHTIAPFLSPPLLLFINIPLAAFFLHKASGYLGFQREYKIALKAVCTGFVLAFFAFSCSLVIATPLGREVGIPGFACIILLSIAEYAFLFLTIFWISELAGQWWLIRYFYKVKWGDAITSWFLAIFPLRIVSPILFTVFPF